jgi:hypothetical protein
MGVLATDNFTNFQVLLLEGVNIRKLVLMMGGRLILGRNCLAYVRLLVMQDIGI